ncbi:TPM domain-containing protein [Avibacterium sp. 21-586]|uniref:TPM domain-containing protein n=1 Tax=Avibacterium sp. 21-586 TaxID=2911534 RepID=UPI0022470260|nr:TPM domain-containing protein [Avibacterium sp. 21-586]MCW9709521.1 TPM domain-containing protein [Avibacterium sp. 21-586]
MGLFSRLPFDKKAIEAAIVRLEQQSSAELRVYIERHIPKYQNSNSSLTRALSVFEQLEMHQTQARNGILIYIAYKDQQCAIVGDEGIDQYVTTDFWQQQCVEMTGYFKQGIYTQGVVKIIENMTKLLAKHFPIQPNDINELDNEVIIND